MTIKPFTMSDLGAFLPNEYSSPDVIFPLMGSDFEVLTMWGDDGLVQAFLCFKNYWGRCWSGFFLIAKNFEKSNILRLKDMIDEGMKLRNAQRLQTESVSDEKLRSWHEFLGFTLEGTKRKMMFDRDYDMWAIVREEE